MNFFHILSRSAQSLPEVEEEEPDVSIPFNYDERVLSRMHVPPPSDPAAGIFVGLPFAIMMVVGIAAISKVRYQEDMELNHEIDDHDILSTVLYFNLVWPYLGAQLCGGMLLMNEFVRRTLVPSFQSWYAGRVSKAAIRRWATIYVITFGCAAGLVTMYAFRPMDPGSSIIEAWKSRNTI